MAKVRLIDADKLLGVFCTDCGMRAGSCSNSCEKDCAVYDTITSAPTVKAQPTKPMLDLIEYIQMMLTTIYDTGGCIQSRDMRYLIGAADRLKELVNGAVGGNDNE